MGEVPSPQIEDEPDSAVGVSRDEMALEFERGDEGGDVVWEFGGFGPDGGPVCC